MAKRETLGKFIGSSSTGTAHFLLIVPMAVSGAIADVLAMIENI